jgi:hypothetical protein
MPTIKCHSCLLLLLLQLLLLLLLPCLAHVDLLQVAPGLRHQLHSCAIAVAAAVAVAQSRLGSPWSFACCTRFMPPVLLVFCYCCCCAWRTLFFCMWHQVHASGATRVMLLLLLLLLCLAHAGP